MLRRFAAILLVAAACTAAVAQQHPNQAKGFDATKVYDFQDLDNVNLFNGNLIVKIPLGPRYDVGPHLSYGFSLVYNGNVWDATGDATHVTLQPSRRSNAGIGWLISLGRLFSPSDPTNQTALTPGEAAFIYESPDGHDHVFEREELWADGRPALFAVADPSNLLRMRKVGTGDVTREIDFPDGTTQKFTRTGASWFLAETRDTYSNRLTVDYPATSAGTNWVVKEYHDGSGVPLRTHTLTFATATATTQSQSVLQSIDMTAFGGATAHYDFDYLWMSLSRPAEDNSNNGVTGAPYTQQLLVGVHVPGGDGYYMYAPPVGQPLAPYYASSGGASGLLRGIELPTGGWMEWDWTAVDYPQGSGRLATAYDWTSPPSTVAFHEIGMGVSKRRLLDANHQLLGEWRYTYNEGGPNWDHCTVTFFTDSGTTITETHDTLRQRVATVTAPDGTTNASYYSVYLTPFATFNGQQMHSCDQGWSSDDYGLPFTRFWTSGGKFLSTETQTGVTSINGGDATTPALNGTRKRSTFVTFGLTPRALAMSGSGTGTTLFTTQVPTSERTVYDDDAHCGPTQNQTCYVESVNRDGNGYGRFRRVSTGGNFETGNFKTTFTNYLTPSTNGAWLLDLASQRCSADEAAMHGDTSELTDCSGLLTTAVGTSVRNDFCYDTTSGFLNRVRAVADPTAPDAAGNLVTQYTSSVNSNGVKLGTVAKEEFFGGDGTTLSWSCSGQLPDPTYTIFHTYDFGVLTSTQHSGVATYDYRADIDASTGLPTTVRDAAGFATGFTYDLLGRLKSVTPPGGAPTTYYYNRALQQSNGTWTAAWVDQWTVSPNNSSDIARSVFYFDGVGRLWCEDRLMPSAGNNAWARRFAGYDSTGRRWNSSTWTDVLYPPSGYQFFAYDDYAGRLTKATPPDEDRHATTAAFTGDRVVTRTVGVTAPAGTGGVAVSSTSYGTPVESPSTRTETYDARHRLVQLDEQSGANNAPTATTYQYDVADHLIGVSTSSGGVTQNRTFTYDGRGLLMSETSPEKSGATTYRYDAKGHVTRKIDAANDLTYTYDAGERLTGVAVTSGHALKSFTFGTSGHAAGQLLTATRHNYIGSNDYPVQDSYTYDGVGGRLSQRSTTLTSLSGTVRTFITQQTWDVFGNLADVTYPNCTACASDRTVRNTYTAGYLTSVGVPASSGMYAAQIAYQPNGLLSSLTSGSGSAAVTDIWQSDSSGMARPRRIAVTNASGVEIWSVGNYAYDAGGNITQIGGRQYRYDKTDRLTQMIDGGATTTYSYDPFGNMTQYATGGLLGSGVVAHVTVPIDVDSATNRLTTGMAYDAAGNLVTWSPAPTDPTSAYTLTWDPSGSMTHLGRCAAGQDCYQDVAYFYDASDERVAVITAATSASPSTLWTLRGAANQVLRRFQESGGSFTWTEDSIWRGTSLLATETPTDRRTYHLDHLGSPRLVTDTNGAIIGTQDFTPFGNGGTTNGTLTQFTGHERDWLGGSGDALDYMHARYYSAQMGRFLSVDPVISVDAMRSPQLWNPYAYVANNPVNRVDRTGRCGEKPDFVGPTVPCASNSTPNPQPKTVKPQPAGGPPVSVPGIPDSDWKFNRDPQNPRGGSYGPTKPRKGKGGGQPSASWEGDAPVPHWDVDDGKGNRRRYDENGNFITPEEAHGRPTKRTTTLSPGDIIGAVGLAILGTAITIMTGGDAALQQPSPAGVAVVPRPYDPKDLNHECPYCT